MGEILSYLSKIDLNIGTRSLFGLLIVVCLLLYSLSLGRTRAMISLLGIYIAFVIEITFPFYSQLRDRVPLTENINFLKIILFFVSYLLIFGILNRSLVKHRLTLAESSITSVVLISMLQLGLLISIILNTLSDVKPYQIPDFINPYFATPEALFFWSLLPIVAIIFVKVPQKRFKKTAIQ